MDTCDVGSSDPPDGAGKYDIQAEERKEVWANFSRRVDVFSHTLSDFPVTIKMVKADDGIHSHLQTVKSMTRNLRDTTQQFIALAPAYHDRQGDIRRCIGKMTQALAQSEADDINGDILLRPIVTPLIADLQTAAHRQEALDIDAELKACQASNFYITRRRGIEQYIKATTDTLKSQMMRRNEWRDIVDECAVAMDDLRLSELARHTLSTRHFDGLAQLLAVSLIISEHRAARSRRSNDEITDAIRATLAEYAKPATQEALGIWFAWKQMPGNKDARQNQFTALLPHDIGTDISTDINSQFCRRANDPYLIATDPDDWDFTRWRKDGKQNITHSTDYLRRMRQAARLFTSMVY